MTSAAENLRDKLIGAWRLVSYESRGVDQGDVTHPMGKDAVGLIMYTPDGFMSAQIMTQGRPPFSGGLHDAQDPELAAAAGGYLAYSGPFNVAEDGSMVIHHVSVSLFPNWIGQTQRRVVRIEGTRLELSLAEPVVIRGERRAGHLVWERATA